jgi:phospholipase C
MTSVPVGARLLALLKDNWGLPQLGNRSTDATAGSLDGMFGFDREATNRRLFLDPNTGEPIAPRRQ